MLETYDLVFNFCFLTDWQVRGPRWKTKIVAVVDARLSNAEFHAYYFNICCGIVLERPDFVKLKNYMHIFHLSMSCLHISHRLFELTNALRNAFLPSKDNKRLTDNLITGVVVSIILYTLPIVFLKFPLIWVSFNRTVYLINPRLIFEFCSLVTSGYLQPVIRKR